MSRPRTTIKLHLDDWIAITKHGHTYTARIKNITPTSFEIRNHAKTIRIDLTPDPLLDEIAKDAERLAQWTQISIEEAEKRILNQRIKHANRHNTYEENYE